MKITAKLFEKEYRGERVSIPIADLPLELLTPENNIMIYSNRGEFGCNGWNEGETYVVITHYREQNEEEKKEFKLHLEALKAKRTEERYKEYLKLKKEFGKDTLKELFDWCEYRQEKSANSSKAAWNMIIDKLKELL